MQIIEKKSLRKFYKELRKNTISSTRNESDGKIFENFISLDEYKKCCQVLAYVSSPIEVDTILIIQKAFSDNKTVLCPKCVKNTNVMYFYKITDFSQLKSGYMGISEPNDDCEKIADFRNAICIVPGLSFDKYGYRLGFGKGFYDRFLADFDGEKIGLCYENCLSQTLPSDKYDIKVNTIVTEEKILIV